jgi:peptidoglycan-associated lipoprotein
MEPLMTRIPLMLIAAAVLLMPSCAHKKSFAGEPADPNGEFKTAKKMAVDPLPGMLRTTVLHYAFDDASLTSASQTQLARIAEVLRVQPWSQIQIAGHCDDRGTEEYNLVLGQRRADVARNYLVALGAQGEQVNTVSYGDLIPTVMGSDEEAWAWNRRSEFAPAPLELFGYVAPMELP